MEQIDSTSKKSEKIQYFASFLQRVPEEELKAVCYYATARAFSKKSEFKVQIGGRSFWSVMKKLTNRKREELNSFYRKNADFGSLVEWALLKQKPQPISLGMFFNGHSEPEQLSITEIQEAFHKLASFQGKGSLKSKKDYLLLLLTSVTPLEAKYLARILTSDTRTGFQEGLLLEAISVAFERTLDHIRYAHMVLGDLGELVLVSKDKKRDLTKINPQTFNPLRSMLATKIESVEEALKIFSPIICEYKIDGFRAQLHIDERGTRIYSRNLEDITEAFPEIVDSVTPSVRVTSSPCIIDGEIVAIIDGKPVFFQDLLTRIQRKTDVSNSAVKVPVYFFAFDLLLYKGKSLLRLALDKRKEFLASIETSGNLKTISFHKYKEVIEIKNFYQEGIANGYEGLMLKNPHSLYLAGKRGKSWLKLKGTLPTLDCVIVGAEWGHGRRTGWLSNYHLAVRDQNDYQIIGKTFKGLTDDEFNQMTEKLKTISIRDEPFGVQVQPQIIVEVEFDNIQESTKYTSGMALRFARIKRIRSDKSIDDVDTLTTVRELYQSQLKRQIRAKQG